MGKPAPAPELTQIRRHARAIGVSVRTNRPSKARTERTYRLIEAASGNTMHAGLFLGDVERALSSIWEERARAKLSAYQERCPTCTTPRVATFRWCTACGEDFEPYKAVIPQVERPSVIGNDAMRFCQWCGRDQSTASGGPALTRTSGGVYLCLRCAERVAVVDSAPRSIGSRDPI